MKVNADLLACFFNDCMNVAVEIMSPIWNNNPNQAYSLAVDGAGVLERAKLWTNDYITGKKEYTDKDFIEKIMSLKTDRRYVNNKQVQKLCDEYLTVLNTPA